LRRALLVLLCTTIVAAFEPLLAADVVVSEDVPVPGGIAVLAKAIGVDGAPDRARLAAQAMRFAYDGSDSRNPSIDAWLAQQRGGAATAAASTDFIPVPLTAGVWSDAVFHRRVDADGLLAAILADRDAALVGYGLTSLDDETLGFLAAHGDLLARLYRRDAAAFAAFASSFHVRDGRIVPPGGDTAVALWEGLVGEKVTRPERFIAGVLSQGDGRTAYLYDAIAALDPPHAAFALGRSLPTDAERSARLKVLDRASTEAFREWRLKALPFSRPIFDLATLLDRVRVDQAGAPLPPASRAVWAAVFEHAASAPASGDGPREEPAAPIDAAWLAGALDGPLRVRSERLDQLEFGQRVFAAPTADPAAVVAVVRAYPRAEALLLSLERLGITDPAVYLAASAAAARLSQLDHYRAFVALAQFQGALALVVRMHRARVIDRTQAEALVQALAAVPLGTDGYGGAMVRWIVTAFPPGDGDVEDTVLAKLAGVREPPPGARAVFVEWEGQRYRLDLPAAEEKRLRRIREKQEGPSIDVAVKLEEIAARLAAGAPDLSAAIASLKALAPAFEAARGDRAWPAGVSPPKSSAAVLAHVRDELTKLAAGKDARKDAHKAAQAAEPLHALADGALAEALLSIAYAIDLGDPDGTVLLAGNVARRHDFGLAIVDGDQRARAAWALPRQDFAPGVPWHVSGSALGLDVALSSLALRRVDASRIGDAPRLTSNERQTFATSVALLNPFALTDEDQAAIVAAIDAGRRRVAALDPARLDAVSRDIALSGRRRREVQWTLAHDPARVESMFSLTELLYLGGAPSAALDAWGMAALPTAGCLCTKLAPPDRWARLTGRPQLGLLATTVADLNLRVAHVLHDARLPAAIARHVLAAAMQDFIDDVRPANADDWLALVRGARGVARERLEDYIAAAAADGPLIPSPGPGSQRH
jgi:hypothetical protein